MFEGALVFNSSVSWASTLNSIHFASMFKNAKTFNQPVPFKFAAANNRDRNFGSMFEGAIAFNQSAIWHIPQLYIWIMLEYLSAFDCPLLLLSDIVRFSFFPSFPKS